VRSNTGTPFRQVVITSDDAFLAVPAADKGNRDCVIIYNAKTGALISKIPIKLPGFKVTGQLYDEIIFKHNSNKDKCLVMNSSHGEVK